MAETIFVNNYDPKSAGLITGKRRCCRCHGYTDKNDVWVLTNLRNEWILVKGTDVNKKVLCSDCAEKGLEARQS